MLASGEPELSGSPVFPSQRLTDPKLRLRAAGDLGHAVAVEPVEPGMAIGMEIAGSRDAARAAPLAIGRIAEQHSGWCIAAGPRSSRTQVHKRPVRVERAGSMPSRV